MDRDGPDYRLSVSELAECSRGQGMSFPLNLIKNVTEGPTFNLP